MNVYVTGGGGTHLEARVASYYLVALLAEAGARGVLGRVVAVKTQQSEIDAPLDDLVVDGVLIDGTATRLDLQITTTLSFTESDAKWNDVVPRARATFRQAGFDPRTRQLGIAFQPDNEAGAQCPASAWARAACRRRKAVSTEADLTPSRIGHLLA